jgi:4-hydroxybenzoyl-CoA reductase subunit beta
VPGLRGVTLEADGGLRIGALTQLAWLAQDPTVKEGWPALCEAVGAIASPQVRNMGTLGGNLCLDTRCTYFNQTAHWRQALGGCIKREGTVCHVVPGGSRCVAALSSDAAPMVLALGGAVVLRSQARGRREVPLDRFFGTDGRRHTVLEPDELLVEVRVPAPPAGAFSGYRKLRLRSAIDFPMLSVAVAGRRTEEGTLGAVRVVVGVLGARPREISGLAALVEGRRPEKEVLAAVGAAAHRQCKPLPNIAADVSWRHAMIAVQVRRALASALGVEDRR